MATRLQKIWQRITAASRIVTAANAAYTVWTWRDAIWIAAVAVLGTVFASATTFITKYGWGFAPLIGMVATLPVAVALHIFAQARVLLAQSRAPTGNGIQRLSASTKDAIASGLRTRGFATLEPEYVWLRYAQAYVDCKAIAFDLADAFAMAGWKDRPGTTLDEQIELTGLRICVRNVRAKPQRALVISEALTEAGVPHDWWEWPTLDVPDRVIVFVYPNKLF